MLAAALCGAAAAAASGGAAVNLSAWVGCPDTSLYLNRVWDDGFAQGLAPGSVRVNYKAGAHPRTAVPEGLFEFAACAGHLRAQGPYEWVGVLQCLNAGNAGVPSMAGCRRAAGLAAADAAAIDACAADAGLAAALVAAMHDATAGVPSMPWAVVDGTALEEPDMMGHGWGWGSGQEDDVAPLVGAVCSAAGGAGPPAAACSLPSRAAAPPRVPVTVYAWHGCPDTTPYLQRLWAQGVSRGLGAVMNLTVLWRNDTVPGTTLQPDFLPFVNCAQRSFAPGTVYALDDGLQWFGAAVCAQPGNVSVAECMDRSAMTAQHKRAVQWCMADNTGDGLATYLSDHARDAVAQARAAGVVGAFPWAVVGGKSLPEPDQNGDDPSDLIRAVCAAAPTATPRPAACA